MKHILLLSCLALSSSQANTPLIDNINQTLNQLKIEAQQVSKPLHLSYDPFYHDTHVKHKVPSKKGTPTKAKVSKKALTLSMILNQKAFINGRWYAQNEKVARYVLEEVNEDSVLLRQKHKHIVLKLETAKNLLVKTEVQ